MRGGSLFALRVLRRDLVDVERHDDAGGAGAHARDEAAEGEGCDVGRERLEQAGKHKDERVERQRRAPAVAVADGLRRERAKEASNGEYRGYDACPGQSELAGADGELYRILRRTWGCILADRRRWAPLRSSRSWQSVARSARPMRVRDGVGRPGQGNCHVEPELESSKGNHKDRVENIGFGGHDNDCK